MNEQVLGLIAGNWNSGYRSRPVGAKPFKPEVAYACKEGMGNG